MSSSARMTSIAAMATVSGTVVDVRNVTIVGTNTAASASSAVAMSPRCVG